MTAGSSNHHAPRHLLWRRVRRAPPTAFRHLERHFRHARQIVQHPPEIAFNIVGSSFTIRRKCRSTCLGIRKRDDVLPSPVPHRARRDERAPLVNFQQKSDLTPAAPQMHRKLR